MFKMVKQLELNIFHFGRHTAQGTQWIHRRARVEFCESMLIVHSLNVECWFRYTAADAVRRALRMTSTWTMRPRFCFFVGWPKNARHFTRNGLEQKAQPNEFSSFYFLWKTLFYRIFAIFEARSFCFVSSSETCFHRSTVWYAFALFCSCCCSAFIWILWSVSISPAFQFRMFLHFRDCIR